MKRVLLHTLLLLCCSNFIYAQTGITNADGSVLTTRYCYEDEDFRLLGTPVGGTFTGCGMYQQNGQWFFNPVVATQGVTVFPYQCNVTYTAPNSAPVTRAMLIYKPVVIHPPLEDSGTCNGEFLLHASTLYAGAYDYNWTPAAPLNRADTSITRGVINQTTTFVITAKDHTSGCIGSDTVTITKFPVPDVNVTPSSITLKARERVQLLATGAEDYYWIPSKWLSNDTIPNPIAYPQAPITYMVVGMNEFGCVDSAEVKIDINEAMYVPNAFSPNGDGLNDVFKVENIGYQGVEFFKIFNRWGATVYETRDGTKGWDGTYKGGHADPGTYFYLIELSMLDGTKKVFKGDVLLIR